MRVRVVLAVVLWAIASASAAAAQESEDGATYTYPPKAAAILALRRWFEADAAKSQATITSPTSERRRAPTGADYWRIQQWEIVTDTPRFLSLSRYNIEAGGAHPLSWSGSMIWDKTMAAPRRALSFFASDAALNAAVRSAFCKRLSVERRRKRGDDTDDFAPWNGCVDPAKTTVMLGSSNHGRFNRIGFRMDPYVAGAYAEGVYEVTLPVTPTILAAVKPAWRGYFAVAAGTP